MQVMYEPWFRSDDLWGVIINSDIFNGTIIRIRKLEFSSTEQGALVLEFDILHKTENTDPEGTDKVLFDQTLEWIINDILKVAIANYENRDTNSQQPDSQS